MEVGPINPTEPSTRLADASSLHQAAGGHHARGGRHLPRSSASSALSQPVRLDLHLLKGSSTEAMSDVFKAQFVAPYACGLWALQIVLWKAVVGQDVAGGGGQDVAGGGGGRADHWGGHAAQAEARCPKNSQQQHLKKKIALWVSNNQSYLKKSLAQLKLSDPDKRRSIYVAHADMFMNAFYALHSLTDNVCIV